jgi:hypothetical protein
VRITSIGVRGAGQRSSAALHRRGQSAQRHQFRLVAGQFGDVGQLAVDEQVGDLLEFADVGDVEDVVAAVMEVVAGAPDRAQRRVAGGDTRKRDGFLRLGSEVARAWFVIISPYRVLANRPSSFCS